MYLFACGLKYLLPAALILNENVLTENFERKKINHSCSALDKVKIDVALILSCMFIFFANKYF